MNDSIFRLQVIKNNSEYEDVAFKSDLLNLNYIFGSAYYIQNKSLQALLRFPEDTHPAANKRIALKHLLSLMAGQLTLLKRDHDLYFPIDMAEEYTGILKCSMDEEEQFFIQFGVVDQEGVGIDIQSLEPIGNVAKSFTAQTGKVKCEKEDLQTALAENLLSINLESVSFITPATTI